MFDAMDNHCHVSYFLDEMYTSRRALISLTMSLKNDHNFYSMTSVGYGQRFPKSSMGKGVAIVAAIFGAFYMAMPLTIIGSTFMRSTSSRKRHGENCTQAQAS